MTTDTEFVTLLRCACGDKEVTESWVPADMCGRCGMPLRRVEVERRCSSQVGTAGLLERR
jgi:rRNA maturation endonuclease Nob1